MAEFNFEDYLQDLQCAEMLKKGFQVYVADNKIKINSKKDFEKNFDKYLNLQI